MSMRSHFKKLFADKVIGLLACLFIFSFIIIPAFAQDQPPPATDDIVSKMQSKLNLTEDQVTAVTPIIEKYSSKRQELRQSVEDGSADKDDIRSQMKQLKEDEKQELGQVLSADQISQWEQMQGQGTHKHKSDGGSNGEGGGDGSSGSSASGGENTSS